MNTLKQYTLFANGERYHAQARDKWITFYSIKSVVLRNNNTKQDIAFTKEADKKLMKSLADSGYGKKHNKSRYDSISRRLRNFYKKSGTERTDWKHCVDASGGVLKIWLTDISYDRRDKRIFGSVVLLKESGKTKNEFIQYQTDITELSGKDGRYHDFSKAGGYKSFTHNLEMERFEMRTNTYVKKLREDASLQENTEHNNVVVEAHNKLVDEIERLKKEIEQLKAA